MGGIVGFQHLTPLVLFPLCFCLRRMCVPCAVTSFCGLDTWLTSVWMLAKCISTKPQISSKSKCLCCNCMCVWVESLCLALVRFRHEKATRLGLGNTITPCLKWPVSVTAIADGDCPTSHEEKLVYVVWKQLEISPRLIKKKKKIWFDTRKTAGIILGRLQQITPFWCLADLLAVISPPDVKGG